MHSLPRDEKGKFIRGLHYSPETEFKRGMIPWNKGNKWDSKTIQKISLANQKYPIVEFECPICHKKIPISSAPSAKRRVCSNDCLYELYRKEPTRKGVKLSEREKEKIRKATKEAMNRPDIKAKVIEGITKKWKDPVFKEKRLRQMWKNRKIKPNKKEKILESILDQYFSNQWKYVGDGYTFIACKVPDFIDFKNKRIIELFGNYWHKPEEEAERISHFSKYGYETLVIWEEELKDVEAVTQKIERRFYT